MHGKKVLITGGFGNLGSWISIYLAKLGYEIWILTQKEKQTFSDLKYKVIECDICDLKALKSKLNVEFDYCIHAASFNEFFLEDYPKKALEINALGTRNLLEVLNKNTLKNFIYFSTFHVYGKSSGMVTEETDLNPKNDYASTHLFAEYYIKQFADTVNLKYTILRLTNSYGCPTFKDTTKWYLVLNDLVKMAYEKRSIVLNSNGKAKRDFIYMGDVCKIVENLLLLDSLDDTFNLSSHKTYEIIELAEKVKAVYKQRYNEDIDITINDKDRTDYKLLEVQNTKLRKVISFEINDYLNKEIHNIFDLLEGI